MDSRELAPTFDPLEPVHNPVTEAPAPAYEQPMTTMYDPNDKRSYEERLDAFVDLVAKNATSNELKNTALALKAEKAGDAKKVSITKYEEQEGHTSPEEALASVPVPRHIVPVGGVNEGKDPFENQEIIDDRTPEQKEAAEKEQKAEEQHS